MRRIIITEFITVDGVIEAPGGGEDFDRGGWAFQFERGEEGDKFKLQELFDVDGQLLGRKTYEGFAAAWPDRDDDAGFAEKMNGMPKYVVSNKLENPTWNNTTVLSGDGVEAVRKLKEDGDGDLLVAGSAQLSQSLLAAGLVDELRLMVFPLIVGAGKKLFPDTDAAAPLKLVESKPVGPDGVVLSIYQPKGD